MDIPEPLRGLRVAIVHAFLNHQGGAENVLGLLAELFPGARRIVRMPAVPGAAGPAFERYALGSLLGSGFDVLQGVKHMLPRGVAARTALTVHDMILFDLPEDFTETSELTS